MRFSPYIFVEKVQKEIAKNLGKPYTKRNFLIKISDIRSGSLVIEGSIPQKNPQLASSVKKKLDKIHAIFGFDVLSTETKIM